jgi:hypothetical protein
MKIKKIIDEAIETEEMVVKDNQEINLTSTKPLETIPEAINDELNIQTKPTSEVEIVEIQPSLPQKEQNQPTIEISQATPISITEDSITNNIQFTKQVIPSPITISFLKKRRSMNYNLNDLTTGQNDTPSKLNFIF